MFFSPIHLDNLKMVINLSECIFQLLFMMSLLKKQKRCTCLYRLTNFKVLCLTFFK